MQRRRAKRTKINKVVDPHKENYRVAVETTRSYVVIVPVTNVKNGLDLVMLARIIIDFK